ncbi:MAG: phosphotransacetylase family protein [Leptolyngbyaceae bacterium]|nr:phosphotransacetylase family protein [Leptolyngbyaceae bacterium]
MSKSGSFLLFGSTEAYSGKSAAVVGIAFQLQEKGIDVSYGKLLGTYFKGKQRNNLDEDIQFIAQTMKLPKEKLYLPLLNLQESTIAKRITGEDTTDYRQSLNSYVEAQQAGISLIEGPGTLSEGKLFGLSLPEVAQILDAAVVLVCRYHSPLIVDSILAAKEVLGDRLIGVMINDVPEDQLDLVKHSIIPFLSNHEINTCAVLPRSDVLRSVSVNELVKQLNAEVLCCADRLDLMVESLKIGAMNVNSALKYFRKARNMAVVTGGDRTDLQLAALETSTHCLILTGHLPPTDTVRSRAEDLEIPILSVDLDTLTTVEIIDNTFGQVRLQEPIKVECVRDMMAQYCDIDSILQALDR